MLDVQVIDDAAVAVAALEPLRARVLEVLAAPGSATSVAAVLGQPRQKINYHLRALEQHGLVRLVEERPRRGLTERVVVASASSYVVASSVLGSNAVTTERVDRRSTRYLLAVAARLIDDVARLANRADAAEQPLATLTIDTEVRFASAPARAAFTAELAAAVHDLAARYHDASTPGGRLHRLVVAAHPHPGAEPRGNTDG